MDTITYMANKDKDVLDVASTIKTELEGFCKKIDESAQLSSFDHRRHAVFFITARCTLVQSAALRSHVVCLSVCASVRPSVSL